MDRKERFIEKLNIISKAWSEASELWDEMSEEESEEIEAGYDLQESFDDIYYNLLAWRDDLSNLGRFN